MNGEQETKIYCCDRGGDNNAILAALAGGMGKSDNNPLAYAAMMNGGMGNNWMNNPFAYLMFMMFAQRMWGNWGDNNGAHNAQIAALQNEMQDNHNADLIVECVKGNGNAIGQLAQNLNCDFNALNQCCCDLKSAVQQVAGQVGFSAERVINAVQAGDCNIVSALKDCCCQTGRQIADLRADIQLQNCQNTAELRNGQRDLGVAMAKGFSDVGYQTQQQTCDIIKAITEANQRTTDQLNNHWRDELQQKYQDAKFELSQQKQNQHLERILNQRLGHGCCQTSCSGSSAGE